MTMYAETNYKSKAAFKRDVAEGKQVRLFAPGLGSPKVNGTEYVSGPWSPQAHSWYAEVTMVNGVVTKVK